MKAAITMKIYTFLILVLAFVSCNKNRNGYFGITGEKEVYQFQCQIPITDFFESILLNYTDPDIRSVIQKIEDEKLQSPKEYFERFNVLIEEKQYKLVDNLKKANPVLFSEANDNNDVIEVLEEQYNLTISKSLEYLHETLVDKKTDHNIYLDESLHLVIEVLADSELEEIKNILNQDVSGLFRIEEVLTVGVAFSIVFSIDEFSRYNVDSTQQNDVHFLFDYLAPKYAYGTDLTDETSQNFDKDSPIIGVAKSMDTAIINGILSQHSKDHLRNIDFGWGTTYSLDESENEVNDLYFFKSKNPPIEITSMDLSAAKSKKKEDLNEWIISISFSETGRTKWSELTLRNLGFGIAIVINGEVVSCPIVQGVIMHGECEISGQINEEEATKIVNSINCFASMKKLDIVHEGLVSLHN